MHKLLVLLLGACTLALSCVASQQQVRETVIERAAFDLGCAREQLQATQLGDTTVIGRSTQTPGLERTVMGVTGCGKKSVYVVECVSGAGGSRCNATLNADEKPQAAP